MKGHPSQFPNNALFNWHGYGSSNSTGGTGWGNRTEPVRVTAWRVESRFPPSPIQHGRVRPSKMLDHPARGVRVRARSFPDSDRHPLARKGVAIIWNMLDFESFFEMNGEPLKQALDEGKKPLPFGVVVHLKEAFLLQREHPERGGLIIRKHGLHPLVHGIEIIEDWNDSIPGLRHQFRVVDGRDLSNPIFTELTGSPCIQGRT